MIKFEKLTISPKRFAWAAAILCVGCCAMIPLLTVAGISTAASIGFYIEAASVGFLILSIGAFRIVSMKNNKLLCSTNCACKDSNA